MTRDDRLAHVLDALHGELPAPKAEGLAALLSTEERAVLTAVLEDAPIRGRMSHIVSRLLRRIGGLEP